MRNIDTVKVYLANKNVIYGRNFQVVIFYEDNSIFPQTVTRCGLCPSAYVGKIYEPKIHHCRLFFGKPTSVGSTTQTIKKELKYKLYDRQVRINISKFYSTINAHDLLMFSSSCNLSQFSIRSDFCAFRVKLRDSNMNLAILPPLLTLTTLTRKSTKSVPRSNSYLSSKRLGRTLGFFLRGSTQQLPSSDRTELISPRGSGHVGTISLHRLSFHRPRTTRHHPLEPASLVSTSSSQPLLKF